MNVKKAMLTVMMGCLTSMPYLSWSGEPPKDRISMEEAEKTALKTYSGKIESKELEYEHKKWIYSFDIRGSDPKHIHEIQIDARTGALVSHTTENAKKEAQEATQEKAEKIKK